MGSNDLAPCQTTTPHLDLFCMAGSINVNTWLFYVRILAPYVSHRTLVVIQIGRVLLFHTVFVVARLPSNF